MPPAVSINMPQQNSEFFNNCSYDVDPHVVERAAPSSSKELKTESENISSVIDECNCSVTDDSSKNYMYNDIKNNIKKDMK